ncbi:MAG: DNA polymerase III subunit alpha [Bacteroidetes bacterium HGW-Bacteroidetes-7]|jgi:DNA polymerase-3 subunit alpha|nr:MAG: DNA polymerase III subunit alpha [Bacteroidetes bacterium HGW-Bacteroidetes-7]
MPFVHLHVHTQYSILDGAANIKKLFKAAQDDKQPALAITDHGNMFGVKEFLETAAKFSSVKPIVGCEVYVAKNSRLEKRGREDQGSYHLVLLAKNYEGYKNLVKLTSNAFIEGFYSKPRIDRELLERYSSGLICSSACLGGEVPQAILAGNIELAEETAKWYKNLFGDDYYLELQRHETDLPGADSSTYLTQCKANEAILEIARKLDIKCIATNDVHFVSADDREAHDRLICLTTNADIDDPQRLRYTKQEYLKSQAEMEQIFSDLPEVLQNTQEIADKVEVYDINSKPIMPNFVIPDTFKNSDDYLKELTYQGALTRYKEVTPEISERIDFELETIEKMGYPDYFLIVQDFIAAARSMEVSVGPGRGSAAGSVVAYCLRITDIDPLKYDLLFERFLNPDRISMPDIDIDFDDDGRHKVLKYVEDKYGKDHVSHVITFGTMAAKSAIRDIARIQRLPLQESDRLAKMIPNRFPTDDDGNNVDVTIENCLKLVPEFADAYNNGDALLKETVDYAKKLEGNVRNVGVHACAIIIGKDDLREHIPITTANDKETGEKIWVSQYDGSQIEKVGMLKMDFLGLKTLSVIKDTVVNIKKSRGIDIDIDTIPIDDSLTYELFSRGDTVGTFQFESDGMRKWLRELKPTRFEDLIAMNALYRPGPMEYIPDFVNRKHGVKQIEYDLKEMEEILSDTYGVTVYQEQVMLLSQKLAGFSRGDADSLRKAMGKKIKAVMDELKQKFIKGGEDNGHKAFTLEKIWKDWEAFAQYAFNKSHSTCYAWIGYQTAYLKANYPAEFMAATLSRNLNDIEELTKLMDECKRMKIPVMGPDVNESRDNFTVTKKGNIRFGMAGIKGVGGAAVEHIIRAREEKGTPFESIFDFIERVNLNTVNRKTIESLTYAGAFDGFGQIARQQYLGTTAKDELFLDALIKYGNRFQNDTLNGGNSLFGASESIKLVHPDIPLFMEADTHEILKREKELVGMYLSAHPLDIYAFEVKHFTTATLSDAADMVDRAPKDETYQGKEIIIAGLVTSVKISYTRSTGKPFANFTVEDFNGSQNFAVYGKDYEGFMQYLQPNLPLIIKCAINPRFGYASANKDDGKSVDYELKIKRIRHLANTKEDFVRDITIDIPVKMITPGFRGELVKKLKENKGKTSLIIKLVDFDNQVAVELISTKYQISLNNDLLDYFNSRGISFRFVPSLSF